MPDRSTRRPRSRRGRHRRPEVRRPRDPLLVSVRSGAPLSMPGMMDTILNLGLDDATVEGLATKTGNRASPTTATAASSTCSATSRWACDHEAFEHEIHELKRPEGRQARHRADRRRPQGAGRAVQGDRPRADASDASRRTPTSSSGARSAPCSSRGDAARHRLSPHQRHPRAHGHRGQRPGDGVRQPRRDCATGVAFTRDPSTGEKRFYGEYLVNAQGEDVVAGIRTPKPMTLAMHRRPTQLPRWRGDARRLRRARRGRRAPREALPRHAGHRVHDPGRPALHAADAAPASAPPTPRCDRRRDGARRG